MPVATHSPLEELARRLAEAECVEDVFGRLAGSPDERLRAARTAYRRLARLAHPDGHAAASERHLAQSAFARLAALWSLAERSLRDGSYERQLADPLLLRTRGRTYETTSLWRRDEIANHYDCRVDPTLAGEADRPVLRVARQPRDNDLLAHEARTLRVVQAATEVPFRAYLPDLLDSAAYDDGAATRRVNTFALHRGLWTLEAVARAYPRGIDPKDAAWILRRLLVALGLAHRAGVVHGAVVPSAVLIQPELHGLVLANWSYAVEGGPVRALVGRYRDFYPEEVLERREARPETDVFMAARTTIALLGGSGDVPEPLRAFFRGCTLRAASRRPDDAWQLKDTLDETLRRVWGPRRFHPFAMPPGSRES